MLPTFLLRLFNVKWTYDMRRAASARPFDVVMLTAEHTRAPHRVIACRYQGGIRFNRPRLQAWCHPRHPRGEDLSMGRGWGA
jgi:hypothetical protein